jgi:hypothetical protein
MAPSITVKDLGKLTATLHLAHVDFSGLEQRQRSTVKIIPVRLPPSVVASRGDGGCKVMSILPLCLANPISAACT